MLSLITTYRAKVSVRNLLQRLRGHSTNVVKGKGLVIIENETREVSSGDAIYIPSNKKHGIKNIGDEVLEYLTANSPVFAKEYEDTLRPADPI